MPLKIRCPVFLIRDFSHVAVKVPLGWAPPSRIPLRYHAMHAVRRKDHVYKQRWYQCSQCQHKMFHADVADKEHQYAEHEYHGAHTEVRLAQDKYSDHHYPDQHRNKTSFEIPYKLTLGDDQSTDMEEKSVFRKF